MHTCAGVALRRASGATKASVAPKGHGNGRQEQPTAVRRGPASSLLVAQFSGTGPLKAAFMRGHQTMPYVRHRREDLGPALLEPICHQQKGPRGDRYLALLHALAAANCFGSRQLEPQLSARRVGLELSGHGADATMAIVPHHSPNLK